MNATETLSSGKAFVCNWSRIKILVVEDFDELRDLYESLFLYLGVQYKLAENGSEAIDLARNQSFDVILMDLNLPIIDGETAMRILRKEGVMTPIIAMSGSFMDLTQDPFLKGQFDDCIAKPFTLKDLVDKLKNQLNKKGFSFDTSTAKHTSFKQL